MPLWNTSKIELWVSDASRAAPAGRDLSVALERATATWNDHARAARAPRLFIIAGPRPTAYAVQDGVSTVLLRTDAWCPPGARDEEEGCYDLARQAITHLYLNADKTEIVEADLELNGVEPHWRHPSGEVNVPALQALLVHELGHVLGLDHSCGLKASQGASAADDLKSCRDPAARASVMYPDPLENGRALLLAPSEDALSELKEMYGGTTQVGGGTLWPVGVGLLIAASALWGMRALRARAKAAAT